MPDWQNLAVGKREEKKKGECNPLVGFPAGTGGVRASSSSGQMQQTKEAFPISPRQPVPLFDNGCHGGSFQFITASTHPAGQENDTFHLSLPPPPQSSFVFEAREKKRT